MHSKGGIAIDSLSTGIAESGIWIQSFDLGNHSSVSFRLASPGNISELSDIINYGNYMYESTTQLVKSLDSRQTQAEYVLIVEVGNSHYDECTSFFLPTCSSHLLTASARRLIAVTQKEFCGLDSENNRKESGCSYIKRL